MANQHVLQRLLGIQTMLNGVHLAGGSLSASSRGNEREAFINDFLAQALPTPYRFGTGDATDYAGNRSGQLDVVVEYPFSPCIPAGGKTKLFLAEGVAAVIEVKSNLADQWNEVVSTASQLANVQRQLMGGGVVVGNQPSPKIPLFAVGYTGWKQIHSVHQHLNTTPTVDGILVIDSGNFVSIPQFGFQASGAWGLWALICCLYRAISSLQATVNNPIAYGV